MAPPDQERRQAQAEESARHALAIGTALSDMVERRGRAEDFARRVRSAITAIALLPPEPGEDGLARQERVMAILKEHRLYWGDLVRDRNSPEQGGADPLDA